MVSVFTESPRDFRCRSAGTPPRQFVDRAVESTVPKCSPLKCPKAVREDTDEVGGNRFDVPARA